MSGYKRIFISLLLLGVLGCTKKKPEAQPTPSDVSKTQPTPEKKDPTLVPSTSPLGGEWTMDLDGFKALEEYKSLPAELQQSAVKSFENMEMKITFSKDQIRMNGHYMGKKKSRVSTYRVIKENQGIYSLETTDPDGTKLMQEVTVTGDKMKIREGTRLIVLKRAK